MTSATITIAEDNPEDAAIYAPVGFLRMLLDGALKDANAWTGAYGASRETKQRWGGRAAAIKALLDQLPPPANPRDPFDDIPGEPTPEEAEARWRARAAAEDAREAARRPEPVEKDGICDAPGCEEDAAEEDLTTGAETCPNHHEIDLSELLL